eukprot:6213170-Pleurochrysis_carterae.AAC.2
MRSAPWRAWLKRPAWLRCDCDHKRPSRRVRFRRGWNVTAQCMRDGSKKPRVTSHSAYSSRAHSTTDQASCRDQSLWLLKEAQVCSPKKSSGNKTPQVVTSPARTREKDGRHQNQRDGKKECE